MSCECDEASPPECPDLAPPWVMTFADLMSLLLAFFVLLFSFSELDKQKYKQVAGSMRNAFGIQRQVKLKEPPKGINIIAQEFSPGTPKPTVVMDVRQHTRDDFRQYVRMPSPLEEKGGMGGYGVTGEQGGTGEKGDKLQDERKLQREGERLRRIFAKEIEEGSIELEIDNPRIIIRILERGSFATASTDLIEPFRSILKKMADAIRIAPGRVVVAGHTDNVPIFNQRFRSNWELSASRAVTVVHELIMLSDASPDRFRIEGYADTTPIDSNETEAGRARNRRVEVQLVYDENAESDEEPTRHEHVGEPAAPLVPGDDLPDDGSEVL